MNNVSKLRAWTLIAVLFAAPIVLMAAKTFISLTADVSGVLPTANGGSGQNSTATFPSSGTIMTTTTAVSATQLPDPSATTLGGIESITALSHNFITSISTLGVPVQGQPNYTDLAGVLPSPGASTLGGIESITCSAGQHIASISTSGVPGCVADSGVALNQAAPTGLINGSNTSYSLSPTPTAAGDVNCFENGLQQQQGAGNDYTISGATITYLTAPPTGTKLNCLWY